MHTCYVTGTYTFYITFMTYLLEILLFDLFSIIIHLNVFNIICVVFLKKYAIDLIFQFFPDSPYTYYIGIYHL